MPVGSLVAIVVVYLLIALLLLSLNFTSRWAWWIKGGAIVVTGAFFIASYFAIGSLFGWPTQADVPVRFSVVATRVVEPDPFLGTDGSIFLWVEELDENNIPSGIPRGFELAYTEPLADSVEGVQDMLDAGEEVEGAREEAEEDQAEEGDNEGGSPGEGQGSNYLPVEFNLIFNNLPPVALPDKGAL